MTMELESTPWDLVGVCETHWNWEVLFQSCVRHNILYYKRQENNNFTYPRFLITSDIAKYRFSCDSNLDNKLNILG